MINLETEKAAWLKAQTLMLSQAFDAGVEKGVIIGLMQGIPLGYAACIGEMKPALSDGLRHGSSECGKKMQELKTPVDTDSICDAIVSDQKPR